MTTTKSRKRSAAFARIKRAADRHKLALIAHSAKSNTEPEKTREHLIDAEVELLDSKVEHYRANIKPILGAYRRPVVPVRPASLPEDDFELLDALDAARGHGFTSDAEKLLAKTFGIWRGSVMRAELVSEGNIIVLLGAARALDAMGDIAEFEYLAMFILREYGLNLPPVPVDDFEVRDVANRCAREAEILPTMLLTERRPRPKKKPRDEEELHFEDVQMDFFGG
jgi:hypothetical protein